MLTNASTLKLLGIDPETLPTLDSPGFVACLDASAVDSLQALLQVDSQELLRILGVPVSGEARDHARSDKLAPPLAEAVLRVARVLQEARRVFGDNGKALRWIKASNPFLAARPIDLAGSDPGAQAIIDELTRIESGDLA